MLIPSTTGLLTLGLLLSFAIVYTIAYFRIERGAEPPALRPFPGVESLREVADRAIEEGRAVHLALGTGRIFDATTAETLMGLIVLDQIAEHSRRAKQIPIATTADPAAMLLATGSLSQGEIERQRETRSYARFVAPQPAAYGAGTRGMMQREKLGLTAAVGYLGDEYLFLAGEQPNGGSPMYAPEIAATAHIETLPLVYLTARNPILGEETFTLGAYLARWSAHLAGVIIQDVGRVLVVMAILVGVLLRSLGVI